MKLKIYLYLNIYLQDIYDLNCLYKKKLIHTQKVI